MRPPLAPSDDPTGGRYLTRRLKIVLPVALVVGLAVGIPLAVVLGDWRPAVAIPLGAAALAGTVAAAIEDGRVQRRVDAAATGPDTDATLREAFHAAHEDDERRAESAARRALLRGASPERVAAAIDHPRWGVERIRAIARAAGEPVSPSRRPPASP